MLKLFVLTLPILIVLAQERPKNTDSTSVELVPISEIPHSCDSPPSHGN